jgi:hypothetical protein
VITVPVIRLTRGVVMTVDAAIEDDYHAGAANFCDE